MTAVSNALCDIYPSTEWKLWKFSQMPQGFWNDPRNRGDYIEVILRIILKMVN
jgi:hypothetical protein